MPVPSGLILGATIIVLLLGSIRGDHTLLHYFKLQQSREILEKTVEDLENENESLDKEIRRIRESPNYARKILREKYHVVDSNEKIIFFAD
ncbi:MAG: FtsB family cell division protein [Oligoflexus sp.]